MSDWYDAILQAKKGDFVEAPFPGQAETVRGKVVMVKKDGSVVVNFARTKDNPRGHSNEDIAWVYFAPTKKVTP